MTCVFCAIADGTAPAVRIPALHPEVRDLAVDLVELHDLIHQLLGDEQDD